jgi:hypothetical protein
VFLIVALAIGYPVLVAIVFVIGIVVANVPEGLLATVTVSLTLTAKRMAKKKRAHQEPLIGRDARLDVDDLQRQDRHADAEPHDVSHLYYNGSVHTNDPGASGSYDANDATCTELLRIAAICNRATFADADQVCGDRAPTKLSVQSWATIGDASESRCSSSCTWCAHRRVARRQSQAGRDPVQLDQQVPAVDSRTGGRRVDASCW